VAGLDFVFLTAPPLSNLAIGGSIVGISRESPLRSHVPENDILDDPRRIALMERFQRGGPTHGRKTSPNRSHSAGPQFLFNPTFRFVGRLVTSHRWAS
jgi:hypothetical protein